MMTEFWPMEWYCYEMGFFLSQMHS